MLKISQTGKANHSVTLRLEGRIVGPWVNAARETCEKFLGEGRTVKLDLAEVSFVDQDGMKCLANLISKGVALVDCSLFVEEQLRSVANG
jgi:ABC-type transporter Mla MlaB component